MNTIIKIEETPQIDIRQHADEEGKEHEKGSSI